MKANNKSKTIVQALPGPTITLGNDLSVALALHCPEPFTNELFLLCEWSPTVPRFVKCSRSVITAHEASQKDYYEKVGNQFTSDCLKRLFRIPELRDAVKVSALHKLAE